MVGNRETFLWQATCVVFRHSPFRHGDCICNGGLPCPGEGEVRQWFRCFWVRYSEGDFALLQFDFSSRSKVEWDSHNGYGCPGYDINESLKRLLATRFVQQALGTYPDDRPGRNRAPKNWLTPPAFVLALGKVWNRGDRG